MGEISDSMLNGLLCDQCGVLIDGEEPGYIRRCKDCSPTRIIKLKGDMAMDKIATAMMDGLICGQCGSFIDGEITGYLRLCEDCSPTRGTKVRSDFVETSTITLDGPHKQLTTNRYLAMLMDDSNCFIEVNGLRFDDILQFRMQLDKMIAENIGYFGGENNE